jgi:hypothetical protein
VDRTFRRRLSGPAATLATTMLLVLGGAPAAAPADDDEPAASNEAPAFASGPVVAGQAFAGALLEISAVVTGNPEPEVAFEWSRCDPSGLTCTVIDGACASSYVVAPADVGSRILARIQLSNSAGTVVARAPFTDLVAAAAPDATPATPPEPGTCIPRSPAPPAPPAPAPPAPAAAPAPLVPAVASPTYLRPFPVVRIRGFAVGRGVRVLLLSVAGPPTARVRAICHGRGCPRASSLRPVAAPVRLRKLERFLRAGTVVEIRVTAPGSIGKYTSFRIRARRAPRRVDRCLLPGRWPPIRCPAA